MRRMLRSSESEGRCKLLKIRQGKTRTVVERDVFLRTLIMMFPSYWSCGDSST